MDDDSLVWIEDESGPGREGGTRGRNVERAVDVSRGMRVCGPNVEDGRLARIVEVLELRRRADERSLVQRDDARRGRGARGGERGGRVDERLRVAGCQLRVRALLVADRRGVIGAHGRTAERAGDVAGIDLVRIRELRQP